MASKVTVGTPNTLGKVWNIYVEREYRKLSYLFQNPERNNVLPLELMHRELKKKGNKTLLSTFKLC